MCGDSRTQRWEFPVKNIRYYSVHAVAVLYICVLMCRILFFQKTGRGCVARVQVMALQHRAAPQTSCNPATMREMQLLNGGMWLAVAAKATVTSPGMYHAGAVWVLGAQRRSSSLSHLSAKPSKKKKKKKHGKSKIPAESFMEISAFCCIYGKWFYHLIIQPR